MSTPAREDLTSWIARLFEEPGLLRMGHNQRSDDLNLGLGWVYYALGRLLHPQHAVVIGSYRGFVPIVLAKALGDNLERGEVTFIDPSMVDDFWKDADEVRAYLAGFGIDNMRHFLMATHEFVETAAYRALTDVGLVFIDGYHSAAQARFDYEAFEKLLGPRGIVLFHDSMVLRPSEIYGTEQTYDIEVQRFVDELKRDPSLQLFDVPFGTGLTLLRKVDGDGSTPLLEGIQGRV